MDHGALIEQFKLVTNIHDDRLATDLLQQFDWNIEYAVSHALALHEEPPQMPLPRSPSQQQQQTVNEQIANIMQSMQANSEGVRRRTARQQSAPVQPSLGLDETLPVDRTQSTPAPSTQAPLEQNPYKNESWLYYLSMLPFRIGYTAVSGTLNVAYHFLRSLIPGGAATETANGANTLQAYLQTTFGRAPTFFARVIS